MNRRHPVLLLTGFLGSGKTTLLNHLLKREDFAKTLVIVNEFGEIGLDHLLVEESSDTILELSNGCLCCSVRGDLVDTLLSLDRTGFERVIIETTGIADPLPIFQALSAHPLLARNFAPALVLTVFDTKRGSDLLDLHSEARHQIALADLIFLSKSDLDGSNENAARDVLSSLNQQARIIADPNDIRADWTSIYSPGSEQNKSRYSSDNAHAKSFNSVRLETRNLLSAASVHDLLHRMTATFDTSLLRIKGLVGIAEHPEKPLVVQVSGKLIHQPDMLNQWPADFEHTVLVAITKNIPADQVKTLFDAYCGHSAPDTPDKQAIESNPLAVPGHDFRH